MWPGQRGRNKFKECLGRKQQPVLSTESSRSKDSLNISLHYYITFYILPITHYYKEIALFCGIVELYVSTRSVTNVINGSIGHINIPY
jgi:hypothetical protein